MKFVEAIKEKPCYPIFSSKNIMYICFLELVTSNRIHVAQLGEKNIQIDKFLEIAQKFVHICKKNVYHNQ